NWDLAYWLYDRSNPRYSSYSQDTEKYRPQIDKIIRRLTFYDDPL
ncbi:gamma-glutamylcyclotransferase, partial [Francisella tularensis subsp. holarctica]|nr:gamma-glutamylcyclotransferase [Francisella tularensis subsp. holarctica]